MRSMVQEAGADRENCENKEVLVQWVIYQNS